MKGLAAQPVSNVEWVERDTLRANDYNPNIVAPPELKLLKVSILEDGWTQPLVVRDDDEIVDGFHRWTVSGDPEVAALTDGRVPVVRLTTDHEHQQISTIRHNRARGVHHVVKMADIVAALVEAGVAPDEIGARLKMDSEEVQRLLDRGKMTTRGPSADGLGKAWVPTERERT